MTAIHNEPDPAAKIQIRRAVRGALSHRGMTRGNIEAVRIEADRRGRGLGMAPVGHAIAECRRRGCGLMQLTAHKTRIDAKRFYERLGFVASHEGLRLPLVEG
jgi:GNAT superfamily N-acetyltransferase